MSYINKAQLINIIYNVTTQAIRLAKRVSFRWHDIFAIPDVITAVVLIMRVYVESK